jgi:hypothetical protein
MTKDKKPVKKITKKVTTNTTKGSLVKVVVNTEVGKWVTPPPNSSFFIDAEAKFPIIKFEIETEQPPPYKWIWKITWVAKVSGLHVNKSRGKKLKTFSESGHFSSEEKSWVADLGKVVGGELTVEVEVGAEKFKKTVKIKGTNPTPDQVKAEPVPKVWTPKKSIAGLIAQRD